MKTFKSLADLTLFFKNEMDCVLYLEQERWHGNVICPHCESEYYSRVNTRLKSPELIGYKDFRCKACDKKYSVLTGTIYENTKMPLRKWFIALYLLTAHKKGISSLQLSRDIGITQKAAWHVLHRLRIILIEDSNEPLKGIVEVDETYVGGKIANMSNKKRKAAREFQGEMKNKSVVMGMVQRDAMLRLKVIDGRGEIRNSVLETVSPDAKLITDTSGVYKGIDKIYPEHQTIDHAKGEFARGAIHTNTIEGAFSLLDRMVIGIYHYISPKHLQKYLIELCYRYNTRGLKDYDRFTSTLRRVGGFRLKYATLIAK